MICKHSEGAGRGPLKYIRSIYMEILKKATRLSGRTNGNLVTMSLIELRSSRIRPPR